MGGNSFPSEWAAPNRPMGMWEPTPKWHPYYWLGLTIRRTAVLPLGKVEYAPWWEYASAKKVARAALAAAFAPPVMATRGLSEDDLISQTPYIVKNNPHDHVAYRGPDAAKHMTFEEVEDLYRAKYAAAVASTKRDDPYYDH